MSVYTDFIARPDSKKQTLVEVDLPEDILFINKEPGIWFMTYSVDKKAVTYNFGAGIFGFGNFGSAGVADLTNDNPRNKVGSFLVDGIVYQKVTNMADLRANNQSFYFDTSNSQINVHFNNFNPPECFGYYKIGVTKGYALQAAYYDDIYYDARIISIPNIVKRKDPLFFGLIRFEGGSIQLVNVDGEFDNFANLSVFGQPVRILFGGAEPYIAAANFAGGPNLMGYWSMDEGSGIVAADGSGNGNNGTFEGTTPAWGTGISDDCGDFAGADERVDCGSGAPLDQIGNGSFWISFWMKSLDEAPLSHGHLFSKFQDENRRIEFRNNAFTTKLQLFIRTDGSTWIIDEFNGNPFDTEFNHIILVINRIIDLALLYMNTVKDAVEINLSSLPADCSNAGNVSWGAIANGISPYEGLIDEMRIYSGVPTEAQIGELYNSPSGHRAASGYAYSNFETVFAGTIEDFTFADGRITINIQDKRKALSRKIPINYYDAVTYPDIKTRNAGKPIPIGYGVIKNAPVICNNEEGSEPFTFKIVDTTNHSIKAIDQVYVEDAAVNHGDEDLGNAVFSLSAGVYTARDKVSVDFQSYESGGTLIDNGLDIIKDLMALFTDTAYNAVNYDTTEWAAETAKVKDMCPFINKEKAIIDIIEDICKSIPGSMIAQDDGLWTFKIRDPDKAPDREIELMELLNPPRVNYESDEYLSSVLVGYNKDWKNDEYKIEIDTSREDAIFELYKERRSRTFETLLADSTGADAATFAATILDLAGEIKPIFTVPTKTQNIDLELEDVVDVEVYQFSIGNYGSVRCEVIGIEKDLVTYIVTLTLRHIEDLEDFDLATLIKWRADGEYAAGDVVTYQGSLWRALDSSIAEIPKIASEYWTKYVSSAFHGLDALASLADDDEVEVYDASEEVYQKIITSNMPAAFHGLDALVSLANTDEIHIYDASGSLYKKIIISNMPAAFTGLSALSATTIAADDELHVYDTDAADYKKIPKSDILPTWHKFADPATGWKAEKTAGWTADNFDEGLEVTFSEVPAGTKAVRCVVRTVTNNDFTYTRKSGDTNISNTPHADEEKSCWICRTINVPHQTVIWLSSDYKAQFAIQIGNGDLAISYPLEYLL